MMKDKYGKSTYVKLAITNPDKYVKIMKDSFNAIKQLNINCEFNTEKIVDDLCEYMESYKQMYGTTCPIYDKLEAYKFAADSYVTDFKLTVNLVDRIKRKIADYEQDTLNEIGFQKQLYALKIQELFLDYTLQMQIVFGKSETMSYYATLFQLYLDEPALFVEKYTN